ncbi:hypothetical protein [uncultured Bilophila sp.]|uniref:hypothetical protein n=1 Tax=uncultured Bilophila sp. TaxID=529385 RepID=UPI0025961F54|nr:hypothetical protein [uncultured Bilophila sp.]
MSRNRKNAAALKKERDDVIRMFNSGKPLQEIMQTLEIPHVPDYEFRRVALRASRYKFLHETS